MIKWNTVGEMNESLATTLVPPGNICAFKKVYETV